MRRASVLIADSQRLHAESLVGALSQVPGLELVEEVAVTGPEAVEMAAAVRPDVVVLGQWADELRGAEVTAAIREQAPGAEVLMVTGLPGAGQVQEALSAGAAGFLPKSVGVSDLVEAVTRVHRGETPVFMEQLWRMVDTINERVEQADEVDVRLAELSEREREVVRLLAEGHPARDLPKLLFISEGTIRNHLHKIMKKTGAGTLQELLRLARDGTPVVTERQLAAEHWVPPAPGHGVTVLVADEQRLFAEALGHALLDVHDLAVLGAHSGNGVTSLHAAVRMAPRVLLYDYWMPATSGRAVARYLSRWAPDTRVIFLSWLHGGAQVADAAASGAAGLVPKGVSLRDLVNCIRDAAAGRPLVQAAPLSRRYANSMPPPDEREAVLLSLSPRELEVLQLVGQGCSFREVAHHVGISAGTAKNHLSSVLRKTGCRSRLEAIEVARRLGYVREPGVPPS